MIIIISIYHLSTGLFVTNVGTKASIIRRDTPNNTPKSSSVIKLVL
jgi:hypothetical protein